MQNEVFFISILPLFVTQHDLLEYFDNTLFLCYVLLDTNPRMPVNQYSAVNFFETDTPHGYVKRFIWMRYLQSFVATTQNTGYKTLIYDGFAGAGLYSEYGSDDIASYGSPLIAIIVSIEYLIKNKKAGDSSCSDLANLEGLPYSDEKMDDYSIKIFLVEANIFNFKNLVQNVRNVLFSYRIAFTIKEHSDECVEIFSVDERFSLACRITHNDFENVDPPVIGILDRLVSFIDPFGYSNIPMNHVEKFLGSRKEIFINFMSQFVNRFFNSDENGMQSLFGMEKDKIESNLAHYESDRLENGMSLYKDTLLNKYETAAYALSFEMRNKSNIRLYHMIFASPHEKGFEAMKEAMNRGSQCETSFSLSDFDILKKGQMLNLMNGQTDNNVADAIFNHFHNQHSVSMYQIRQFVLHDTIFVWRKKPLKVLLNDGRITNVENDAGYVPAIKGTFPDRNEWFITFALDSDVDDCASGIQQLQL